MEISLNIPWVTSVRVGHRKLEETKYLGSGHSSRLPGPRLVLRGAGDSHELHKSVADTCVFENGSKSSEILSFMAVASS